MKTTERGVPVFETLIKPKSKITLAALLIVLVALNCAMAQATYTAIDLGTLGGPTSTANTIDPSGQVGGFSLVADGSGHAFFFTNGKMNDLGTLGGATMIDPATGNPNGALGSNARGEVVGFSATDDGAIHALLFTNGQIIDLNAITDLSPAGFQVLRVARAINDSDLIVGDGIMTTGDRHAFLLVPADAEKSPAVVPTQGGQWTYANDKWVWAASDGGWAYSGGDWQWNGPGNPPHHHPKPPPPPPVRRSLISRRYMERLRSYRDCPSCAAAANSGRKSSALRYSGSKSPGSSGSAATDLGRKSSALCYSGSKSPGSSGSAATDVSRESSALRYSGISHLVPPAPPPPTLIGKAPLFANSPVISHLTPPAPSPGPSPVSSPGGNQPPITGTPPPSALPSPTAGSSPGSGTGNQPRLPGPRHLRLFLHLRHRRARSTTARQPKKRRRLRARTVTRPPRARARMVTSRRPRLRRTPNPRQHPRGSTTIIILTNSSLRRKEITSCISPSDIQHPTC